MSGQGWGPSPPVLAIDAGAVATRVHPILSVRFELALGAGALLACAGTPDPKPENHACFRALECRAGLVCVEGRCTADLTPIVPEGSAPPRSPAPSPAGTGDAGIGDFEYD